MTLLTAYYLLLHQYTHKDKIIIVSFFANRSNRDFSRVIGFFTNALPLYINLTHNQTFSNLAKTVKATVLEAQKYQDLPFGLIDPINDRWDEDVREYLQLHPRFTLQYKETSPLMKDMKLIDPELHTGVSKFPLFLNMQASSKGLEGVFEYSTDLFTSDEINQIVNEYTSILRGFMDNISKI